MFEGGSEAIGIDIDFKVRYDEEDLLKGNVDPFQNPLVGPYIFADGILAPKPMPNPDAWEPMGELEYRALYYTLCKFNQLNRTGVEWKAWGPAPDEIIYSYPDTAPYYFVTLYIFLDVVTKLCGPTARKIKLYEQEKPEDWKRLVEKMEEIAGGGEFCQHNRISVKQFMEMMHKWKKEVGIPKDIHAALADFVPGMCNIFRIRQCAVMLEYEKRLSELGGQSVGAGIPDVPSDVAPEEPRGDLLNHAILFDGDGSQRLGMMKDVAQLPRVREKLEVANRILGFDLLDLCLNGPLEKLESLEYNSVAMYMAGWAAYEKFLDEDRENARRARAVAGIDVGEYVALTVAGVLPFEAGLELALARGKAMQELSDNFTDQAVCSVAGLLEERVRQLCDLAVASAGDEKDCCQITTALFNGGYVVGGRTRSVQTFQKLAEQDGALQVKILPNQKANHSPIMHPVQWAIKSKLREVKHKMKVPWCDVHFNAMGEFVLKANGGDSKDALSEVQFATTRFLCETCWSPCRWDTIVQTMIDNGIKRFYECGPTKQLKALMKRISKESWETTTTHTV